MDDLFSRDFRRNQIDLNIVPIMDMLICVIFFLLLSTTFMGFTNLQVPPSAVTTVTDPGKVEPLAPKMMAFIRDNALQIRLEWRGAKPGAQTAQVAPQHLEGRAMTVQEETRQIVQKFKQQYPGENTLQMSLSAEIPYQILIAMMDGAREQLPDVVLYSYAEVDARTSE